MYLLQVKVEMTEGVNVQLHVRYNPSPPPLIYGVLDFEKISGFHFMKKKTFHFVKKFNK